MDVTERLEAHVAALLQIATALAAVSPRQAALKQLLEATNTELGEAMQALPYSDEQLQERDRVVRTLLQLLP